MLLYNITNVADISREREYELPDIWVNSILGFGCNVAATTDRSTSKTAMFYCDPSARILLMTARPDVAGQGPSHWLFINESYFRPPSHKSSRPRIAWKQWSQSCVIRDAPTQIVGEPCVIGTRVVYLETNGRSPHGYHSRLNVIDFAPYPEASACPLNPAWTMVGSHAPLLPSETNRDIPNTTTDGKKVENFRVTEDNIVLIFVRCSTLVLVNPINCLAFRPPTTGSN